MSLDELTLGDIKKLQSLNGTQTVEPICEVGKAYFIRSVTHHYTGRCTKVNSQWIELEDAAWIADDGRFHTFLKTGEADEVEPYVNSIRIPISCILDITFWPHRLPREQK